MGKCGLAHQAEGNLVQIAAVAQFDAAQVETHDGGIFSGHVADIRTGQPVVFPVRHTPGMAVREIVLVAVKDLAFRRIGGQAFREHFLRGSCRLLSAGRTGRQKQCTENQGQNRIAHHQLNLGAAS